MNNARKCCNLKRKVRVVNCGYFKSCGNVFGGCNHPRAVSVCIYNYLNECDMSKRKLKGEKT